MKKPTGKLAFAYSTIARMEKRILELENERDFLSDDLIDAENQAREAENKFKDIESFFLDEDGYPLIEPFTSDGLSDWIAQRDLEQQVKALKEYSEDLIADAKKIPVEFENKGHGGMVYNLQMRFARDLRYRANNIINKAKEQTK